MSLLAKAWRDVRLMTITYTLVLEAALAGAILMWPTLRNEVAAIGRIIPAKFLQRMFDAMSSPDEEAAYNAYMAVQMFFKGTNILGLAFAVLLGTGVIAREREIGTLEFLLARPVSRSRVLATKVGMLAMALVVPIFLTSLSAVPLSWVVDERLDLTRVLIGSAHASAFALLFLAGTTLASVLARTQVHVAFVVGVVIISQVILFFIQQLRVASLFRLSDFDVYGPIMMGRHDSAVDVLIGTTSWILLAAVVLYAIADRAFRRIEP